MKGQWAQVKYNEKKIEVKNLVTLSLYSCYSTPSRYDKITSKHWPPRPVLNLYCSCRLFLDFWSS